MGNAFEAELAVILSRAGYWVYRCPPTLSLGQPADIIACRNGKSHLIDAKICGFGYFDKHRIEDNQYNAMTKFSNCGNGEGLFAVKFDKSKTIYMATLSSMSKTKHIRLNEEWFRENCPTIERWLMDEYSSQQ